MADMFIPQNRVSTLPYRFSYCIKSVVLHLSAALGKGWENFSLGLRRQMGEGVRLKTIGRCNILTLKAQSGSQAWCLTPVTPAPWRWGLKDLGFKVIHPSLCRKFGDSLGYMRSCLKIPKQNRRKKKKQ